MALWKKPKTTAPETPPRKINSELGIEAPI
jgi:hypothetical protein